MGRKVAQPQPSPVTTVSPPPAPEAAINASRSSVSLKAPPLATQSAHGPTLAELRARAQRNPFTAGLRQNLKAGKALLRKTEPTEKTKEKQRQGILLAITNRRYLCRDSSENPSHGDSSEDQSEDSNDDTRRVSGEASASTLPKVPEEG